MQTRTTLEELGFDREARVVVIHADDVGMCPASVTAYRDLATTGLLSSASVMVPCPGFEAVAEFCRDRPELDMGVHLTLTSEWTNYRWRPISTDDRESGMFDDEGYFWRSKYELQDAVSPEAALREMEAQLDRALDRGMQIRHLDSHMFSALHAKLFAIYVELGLRRGVLPVVVAGPEYPLQWSGEDGRDEARRVIGRLRQCRLPTVDDVVFLDIKGEKDDLEKVKRVFDALKPGLTHLALHAGVDTPQFRAITPAWRERVAEHAVFMDSRLRDHVESSDIHVIDYGRLREVMMANQSAARFHE